MEKSVDNAGVRFPPPLIFVLGLVAAWLLEEFDGPFHLSDMLGERSVILGFFFVFLAVGLGIVGWAIRSFRRADTAVIPFHPTTAIVEAGPYQLTRNPMYVGMAFVYLGLGALISWGWSLVLLPVVLVVINYYVIKREERYLSAKFGQPYDEYRTRVRRWI